MLNKIFLITIYLISDKALKVLQCKSKLQYRSNGCIVSQYTCVLIEMVELCDVCRVAGKVLK